MAHEGVWHSPGRMTVLVWATDAAETIRGTLAAIVDQSEQRIDLVVVDSNSTDATAHVVQQWMAAEERRFGSVSLVRTTGDDRQSHILNSILIEAERRTSLSFTGTALSRESIFELRTTTDPNLCRDCSCECGGWCPNQTGGLWNPSRFPLKRGLGWAGSMIVNPLSDLCQRVEELAALRTVATPTE